MPETTKHILRWNLGVLSIIVVGFVVQLFAHAKLDEGVFVGSFGLLPYDAFVSNSRKIFMILAVCPAFVVFLRYGRNAAGAIFFAGGLLNLLEASTLGSVNDFIVLPWFWEKGFGTYYCSVGDVLMSIGATAFILLFANHASKRFRGKIQRTTRLLISPPIC